VPHFSRLVSLSRSFRRGQYPRCESGDLFTRFDY
jgi:hypothetical protein